MKSARVIAALAPAVAMLLAACAENVDTGYQPRVPYFRDYVAGKHAARTNDSRRAATSYLAALQKEPDNPDLLQRSFETLVLDGQLEAAIDIAERMLPISGEAAEAALLVAVHHLRAREYEAARAMMGRVTGIPAQPYLRPILAAWIEAGAGYQAAAFDALGPLKNYSRLQPIERSQSAYLLDYFRRDLEAEDAYKALIDDESLSGLRPLAAYAGFLVERERPGDALAVLHGGFERYGENPFLEREIEALDAGEDLWRHRIDPAWAAGLAFYTAANDLTRGGDRNFALFYANLAAYLREDFDEANLIAGNILAEESNFDAALRAYARIDNDEELRRAAALRRARTLDRAERSDEAIAELRRLAQQRPDDIEVLSVLGDIYRSNERFEDAALTYGQAVAAIDEPEQSHWFLFFTRGISYERLKRWDDAEADLLMALELFPEQPQVLNYLGYSWIDRGLNIDQARDMIERAVAQRPNDGFIIDSLGWVHYLLGDYDEAVKVLERAVLLEPGDPTINDHLGDAYWQAGRKIEARFQWNHALNNKPDDEQRAMIIAKLDYGLELAQAPSPEPEPQ